MEWGMVIVIAGAACLAKSLMDLFERLEHPAKGTKKTAQLRQTTARSVVTQGNHESIIIILHWASIGKSLEKRFDKSRK